MKKYRINPATAIACVALFFSLGGAGYAAGQYIITSRHQIKPSVLRHLTPAPQSTHTVFGSYVPVDQTSGPVIVTAYCPAGTQVTGGGLDRSSPYLVSGEATTIISSEPAGSGAWSVEATNTGTSPVEVRAVAVCLG